MSIQLCRKDTLNPKPYVYIDIFTHILLFSYVGNRLQLMWRDLHHDAMIPQEQAHNLRGFAVEEFSLTYHNRGIVNHRNHRVSLF